jgi:sodium/bile acid cotransporter 7
MKWRPDFFLLGLVAVVALGILWPDGGRKGGVLPLEWVTSYGVCVVFFLYGLTLDPTRLLKGLADWRVHVLTQVATYALFPALVALAWWLLPDALPTAAWTGFVYLAALPTTIASSVAMGARANGNVASSIFNVTVSSLLAVVLTPLLVGALLHNSSVELPLLPTILKVATLVLLPLLLGQVARIWLGGWAERNRRFIKPLDRIVILIIVYASFAESIANGSWAANGATVAIAVAVGCAVLFAIAYFAVDGAARAARLDPADRIVVLYCGVQKSLASGVPLAPVIFPDNPDLGLIILPVLIFHFGQLLIFGALAPRHAARVTEAA